jgi:hypothetical protein
LFRERVALQFGIALPIVIGALAILIVLAVRRRAFAALLCIALADFMVMYFARSLQPWAGYPRLNLVPLALASAALGLTAERLAQAQTRVSVPHESASDSELSLWSRLRVAQTLLSVLLLAVVLNCIPLTAAMKDAFRPSSARSFIEHSDAPLFFPIREALERLPEGSRVDVLTNGKRIFQFFWAGPFQDQYPDLAARYRLRSASFADDASRCRCTDPSIAHLAAFIRFTNLGTKIPQRAAIEAEAKQCEAEIRRTCSRVSEVRNEKALVGLLGFDNNRNSRGQEGVP